MKLSCISDLHLEQRAVFDPPRPEFDVLVVAGDVSENIEEAIHVTAKLAGGKPAVFVGGNHEFRALTHDETMIIGIHYGERNGVHFLENDTVEIGGVRFAGCTLWEPGDAKYEASVEASVRAGADVVVTHYEPHPSIWTAVGAHLWIYGHRHGFSDRRIGHNRLVRNALGYMHEKIAGEPARDGLVIEI